MNSLLTKLHNVRRTGNGWSARCPAHDDRRNSLSIGEAPDGKILIHCHAGCAADQVLAAVGLTRCDLHGQNGAASPTPRSRDHSGPLTWLADYCAVPLDFVARLPLEAQNSALAFTFGPGVRKLREAGTKRIWWEPQGAATPPLWPLPEAELPGVIWLMEGETDCLVGRYLGLPAYALTRGANGTLSKEQAATLAARGVHRAYIAFDADGPGREGANKLAQVLLGAGIEAQVVDLAAGGVVDPLLGEKDVRDAWLRLRDRSALLQRLEACLGLVETSPAPSETTQSAIPDSRSLYTSGIGNHDISQSWAPVEVADLPEPAPRRWLLPELLPCDCLSIWYGDAGTFKSYLAVALAVAKTGGSRFLGYDLEPGHVLFVDSELDKDEFARRAYRVARGFGLSSPPKGLYYLRLPASLAEDEAVLMLQTVARTCQAELTIVDSLTYASLGADLKEASDTSKVLSALIGLGTVLVLDHIPKPLPGANLSQYRPYGSFAKWALGRHIVQVLRAETGGGLVLRPAKTNFGPLGAPIGVAIAFEDGAVRVERVDIADEALAGVEDHLPALERVARALAECPEGATPAELAQGLGMSEKTVRNHLTTLRLQGRAEPVGDGRWRAKQAATLSQFPIPDSRFYKGPGIGNHDISQSDGNDAGDSTIPTFSDNGGAVTIESSDGRPDGALPCISCGAPLPPGRKYLCYDCLPRGP